MVVLRHVQGLRMHDGVCDALHAVRRALLVRAGHRHVHPHDRISRW